MPYTGRNNSNCEANIMIMLQAAFFLQVILALQFAFLFSTGLKTAGTSLYLISSFSKLIRILQAFISTFL